MTTVELTERQQEIQALVSQGKSPKEIGAALGISENAVFQQKRRIRERLEGGAKVKGHSRKAADSPKPLPAPEAPAPTNVPKIATPLQAIRARVSTIEHELKAADDAVAAAERAVKAAVETHNKLISKHFDELKALTAAEAVITGKPAAKAAKPKPAPQTPAAPTPAPPATAVA